MRDNFKIHSICVVKNEADIIEHCLTEAAKWSDYIYIYDGESTDGTWEKVLAMQSEKIIPWKRHDKVTGGVVWMPMNFILSLLVTF